MQRQPKRLSKSPTHYAPDRENLSLAFARNQPLILQDNALPLNFACLTSCREIWACSSWMLLVATGLSSISLWAPSMSSWRCCISCSYCSYCTTASFEGKKKKKTTHAWLSVYSSNCVSDSAKQLLVTQVYPCVRGTKKWWGKFLDNSDPQLYSENSEPSL